MQQKVNWSGWAAHAQPLTCPACSTEFAPNHPRRRFCGQPDCPGRQRRRAATNVGSNAPRPRRPRRRASANTVYALLASAMLDAASDPPEGTEAELVRAAVELVRGVRQNRPLAAERAATVRLLAIAVERTARLTRGAPA